MSGLVVRRTFLQMELPTSEQPQRRSRSISDFSVTYDISVKCADSDPESCGSTADEACSHEASDAASIEERSTASDSSDIEVQSGKVSSPNFGIAGSNPLGSQVYWVPMVVNGVQMLMPMVAGPHCCAQVSQNSAPDLKTRAVSSRDGTMSTELGAARKMHMQVGQSQRDPEPRKRTTLMLRNLPKSYTRSAVLSMLDAEGFAGCYNFIYAPTDFKTMTSFGYAFVAFRCHEEALRAKAHFQGYSTWSHLSDKACDVAWSGPVQGVEQHTERYRNSPVMHASVPDEYKPAVFVNGVRVAFPAPTRPIQPPRSRHDISGNVLSMPS
jgi:hypothetical protein